MHSAYAIRATAHTSPGQQHAVAVRHPTDLTCPTARTPASARSKAVLGRGGLEVLEVPRKLHSQSGSQNPGSVRDSLVGKNVFFKENILSYPQFVSQRGRETCGHSRSWPSACAPPTPSSRPRARVAQFHLLRLSPRPTSRAAECPCASSTSQ
jgi:hypothetical protein